MKMMKKILISLLILTAINLNITGQNLFKADYKTLHFGFMLGLNAMDFGITPTLDPINRVIYEADIDRITPGFSVGVIGNLRLSDYFALRLIPSMHFGQRDLVYVNRSSKTPENQTIKSNLLTVPLYLKYASVRIKNYRPYLIGGVGMAFDLGRERDNPVLLRPMDAFFDFGVGCTLYFQYFRFSPEIKFSMGLTNVLTPLEDRPQDFISDDNKRFTQALSRLTSRLVTLTFNFE